MFGNEGVARGLTMQPRDWKADVDAIRSILISEWDPIGCGIPDDEYDGYIPGIYRLMQARVSIEELEAHLQEIETQQICLRARPEENRRVAKMLLDLINTV
jgi:hypothetical protein